jgi:uncharacterized iron-regulated protein
MRLKRTAALAALLALAATSHADDPAINLPIGDPARKDKTAPIVLDGATDTTTGETLTPAEMAARLKDVRVLFVGESHTSQEFHAVQLATIKALKAAGREVLIGLEMYPYTEQASLDKWNAGGQGEPDFVNDSRWYKNWGYHWNYYRDIFLFAKANGVKMYGVNTPREVVSAVRKKGFKDLTPDEAARIPAKIDTENLEHQRLFKAFFGSADGLHGGMSDEQFTAMFRAQCTWDATMGYNAVQALKQHGGKDAIMVVLIGSGHVAYGLGAERQAKLWFDGKMASLIPIVVEDEDGKRPTVRASYASFLWGVAREDYSAYPSLGLSTAEAKVDGHYKVIMVQPKSVAAAAGFKVGDLVTAVEGKPYDEKETFNKLLSEKRWGDSMAFTVKRGEESLPLTAKLRRTLREKKAAEGAAK